MDLGSLYDILRRDTIVLDDELLLSILQDISQGLRFLHASDPPIIHGDLKVRCVLILNLLDLTMVPSILMATSPYFLP